MVVPPAAASAADSRAWQRFAARHADLGGGLSIAIEAGNQTAWVHEELVKLGAQVTVVNPTKVKLIAESRRKKSMPLSLPHFLMRVAIHSASVASSPMRPFHLGFNRSSNERVSLGSAWLLLYHQVSLV